MTELKTHTSKVDPAEFIAAVEPASKRDDAVLLDAMFRRVTGLAPRMWGPTIIGYGSYHYRYDSGHEGRSCRLGFSPRKAKHSLYLLGCGDEASEAKFAPLLAKLGKNSRGASCLYVNKLADIDFDVLEEMARLSWSTSFEAWPES